MILIIKTTDEIQGTLYDERNSAFNLAIAILHDYHFNKKEIMQLARAVVDLTNERAKLIKYIEELEDEVLFRTRT